MRDVVIAIPDEQKVQADLLPLAARAEQLVVTTLEEHGYAQEYLKEVAQAERAVKQLFEDPKQAAFTAHRSICDAEHKLLDPLKRARQVVTKAIVTYEDIERQRALEEQRRLADEARKKAEEQALAEAEAIEKAGDPELAKQVLEDAATAPPPPVRVAPKVTNTVGVTTRTTWRAEVTDLQALIRHVAANPGLSALLEPNMTSLNAQARSLRNAMNIPGVRAISETQKQVRAA